MKSAGSDRITVPFLKWAGGKRWFCERYLDAIPKFPGRYIEPFLGSAAVFFSLTPNRAILSDLNYDLISAYVAVRDHPNEVYSLLQAHQIAHSAKYYYKTRAEKPTNISELAAWFIYLNRTCWNGLYRVNRSNEFNVPIGTKTDVIMKTDDFVALAGLLNQAELYHRDFEKSIDEARNGDFIFVDPPYTAKHNFNGFLKYNDRIFSWDDQVRLRDAVQRAVERGARVMILNANHESIRELYGSVGEAATLSRASVLAGDPSYRSRVEELMVCSWLPSDSHQESNAIVGYK